MRRILLTIISLLPLLSYGQSMKIAPKQIEAGANGNVIITRNGINTLDNIDWTDINNIPNNLEHTANKINSLGSNLDATHYISGKAIDEWGFIWRGAFSGSALDVDNAYRSGYYILRDTPSGTLPSNYNSSLSSSLQIYNQGITSSNYQYQVLTQTDGTSWWRMANYQGSWSDWQQYASQDWVNNNFLTSETDPVYTADKPNIIFSGDNNSLLNNDAGYITSASIPTVNDATLTLSATGIATGSQTFTANSATNKTFTVNVPGTNLGSSISGNNLTITSSTGSNTSVTLPTFTETDPIYTADNENIMIRRDDLSSSENLNDVLVSGVYFQLVNNNATTALNYPLAGQGGVLEVLKGSDNRAMQRFTARPTSSTPITFVRRMYANAWSDWVQLANIDDIPDVNNGTLTLNTSGIATGSTTFSANQANNSSVTVNVPGTNLGGNFNATTGALNVTSSTGNNATLTLPALQSGDYAPSVYNLSGFTNVTPASGGGYDFIYSQVGNVVTVSGSFEYTTDGSGSGSTTRTFDFDPPIPVTTMRAWGTGSYSVKTNGASAAVIGASNMLRITLNDDINTTHQVYFTCQYIVD